MYKRHVNFGLMLFVFAFVLSLYFQIRLPENSISELITFFSIVFGFYLTALSILYGSSFSKRLHSEEDPLINTQTKLQTLISYFRGSSTLSILSIVLLLVMSVLGIKQITAPSISEKILFSIMETDVTAAGVFTAISIGMISVNIQFMSILFRIFFNAFIEEGGS